MPGYKLWAPFERLLADDLNSYLSQQIAAIFSSAANRDIAIPAPELGQPAYLTDLRVLTRWSGSAWKYEAWSDGLPGATLKSVGTQSIAAGTLPKITILTAVERDTHGYALGSSELTIPAGLGGRYEIVLTVDYAASTGGGHRYATIEKVAGLVKLGVTSFSITANTPSNFGTMCQATLAAGDKIQASAGNGTAAASVLQTVADFATKLSLHRIGD